MAKSNETTPISKKHNKSVQISIQKYFQLSSSSLHKYTQAYLVEQFRDIIKTEDEWKDEIKIIMEGDK